MNNFRTSTPRRLQVFFPIEHSCSSCYRAITRRPQAVGRNVHHYPVLWRPAIQDAKVSRIARQIRETGELPPLPTKPIVDLPKLPHQRESRDRNIVRDDIQATLETHYAANVLAHGNIHIKLDGSSYSKPQRLAVTPPEKLIHKQDQRYISADGNVLTDLTSRIVLSDDQKQHHHSQAVINKTRIKANQDLATTSVLRDKLQQANKDLDSLHRLDAEIQIFQEWIEPSQEEQDAALYSWLRFQQIIKEQFPEYKFELHGSRATGLASPFSDIDIKITMSKLEKQKPRPGGGGGVMSSRLKKKNRRALTQIKTWMDKRIAHSFKALSPRPGRVPVLEIQDQEQPYLNIELSTVIGKPIEHNTTFTRYFLTEYPQIKPLFLLLRWWLQESGFGDSQHGGLSSYLIFSMILTSITHAERSFESAELGVQLLQFLRFWTGADWQKSGFAPDPARIFPKFASNIVRKDNLDLLHSPKDVANKTSYTNEVDDINAAEKDLSGSQLSGAVPRSNAEDTNPALSSTSTQLPLLDRLSTRSGDVGAYGESSPESDVYLDGIKFLTRTANGVFREPELRQNYFLMQDPADPGNNIGAGFRRWPELLPLMRKALLRLESNLKAWDKRQSSSTESQAHKFLLENFVYVEKEGDRRSTHPDMALQKYERRREKLIICWQKSLMKNNQEGLGNISAT